MEKKEQEITKEDLKQINEEHFKNRPSAVRFCLKCDLENKRYCSACTSTQINKI